MPDRLRAPPWRTSPRPSSIRSTRSSWACSATPCSPDRPARPARRRLPHRVLHQDRPGPARRLDQPHGDRHRRRPGDHPGAGADHRRLPVHLVARRQARPRRQAPRAAGVGGVDLRGQRGHRGGRRGTGQARAARLHRQPGRSSSPCRRSSCCPGWPTCSGSAPRWPGRGSAATSTPPPRSPPPARSSGEQALQIATIVKATQNALIGVVAVALTAYFAVQGRAPADAARPPAARELWERFPKFVLGFLAASVIATWYAGRGQRGRGKPSSRRSTTCGPVPDPGLRQRSAWSSGSPRCARRAGARSASSPPRPWSTCWSGWGWPCCCSPASPPGRARCEPARRYLVYLGHHNGTSLSGYGSRLTINVPEGEHHDPQTVPDPDSVRRASPTGCSPRSTTWSASTGRWPCTPSTRPARRAHHRRGGAPAGDGAQRPAPAPGAGLSRPTPAAPAAGRRSGGRRGPRRGGQAAQHGAGDGVVVAQALRVHAGPGERARHLHRGVRADREPPRMRRPGRVDQRAVGRAHPDQPGVAQHACRRRRPGPPRSPRRGAAGRRAAGPSVRAALGVGQPRVDQHRRGHRRRAGQCGAAGAEVAVGRPRPTCPAPRNSTKPARDSASSSPHPEAGRPAGHGVEEALPPGQVDGPGAGGQRARGRPAG